MNSEIYIICKNFYGIKNNLLDTLEKGIKELEKNIKENGDNFVNDLFDIEVPEDFLNKIKNFNDNFIDNQINKISNVMDLIKEIGDKISYKDRSIFSNYRKEQIEIAIDWCNKYNIQINDYYK